VVGVKKKRENSLKEQLNQLEVKIAEFQNDNGLSEKALSNVISLS